MEIQNEQFGQKPLPTLLTRLQREKEVVEETAEVKALKEDPTKPVSSFSPLADLSLSRRFNHMLYLQESSSRPERFVGFKLIYAQAKMHGNEPSKGAKIDAQLQKEEEEELRRKGKLN